MSKRFYATRNDSDECGIWDAENECELLMDDDPVKADRFLAALNVAGAGVDLGEFAKRLCHYRGFRHESDPPYQGTQDVEINFRAAIDYFERIANAVEGGGE